MSMARLTPAEQSEQSYDLAMMALADCLTREQDAATTVDTLIRILDRDSLRETITEALTRARASGAGLGYSRPNRRCRGR